jgi:hypothetical protein
MADARIHIEGLEPLLQQITTLAELRAVQARLKSAGLYVKGKVAQYPEATAANRPGRMTLRGKGTRNVRMVPMGWYERGAGWRNPSGRLRATSETLGRRWTIRTENSGMTVIIGNNASYAPLAQDEEKQSKYLKLYGWKTAQAVMREETHTVTRYLRETIETIVGGK